ncbi:MAG TPA: glycosyltransferase family 39 protein [Gemmata sp.]|nr:glycosyltransferase family 39 protein [Gemmata sp.]
MRSTTAPRLSGNLRNALVRRLAKIPELIRNDPVLLALVALIGVVAFAAHAAYRDHLRVRFASMYHDRNAHYQAGLNVACELRNGHLIQAVRDLDAASMVWPVFHPACLAAVLAVGGPNPAAAVLPSLLGWCGATFLAFLIARRLGGEFGAISGFVAAAFFLGSPALQALATDIMLESLGLCLTLAAIYAYLNYLEQPSRRSGMLLGLSLACLFLHKYNYWVLVVLALTATEVLRRPREWLGLAWRGARMVDWPAWAKCQFRRPLNYPIAALLCVSLAAWIAGGLSIAVGGRQFEIRDTRIPLTIAYGIVLLRLAAWWWPEGRRAAIVLIGEAGTALVSWATIAPLVWLLMPFRLKTFFWFSSAANTLPLPEQSLADGFHFYLDGFVGEYHVDSAFAIAAALFAVIGVAGLVFRMQRIAGRFVLLVAFLLSAALAIKHPNHQLRFLHTWAPLLWVMTGVGVATMLMLAACFAGDRTARLAGVAVVVALAVSLVQLTPAFARVSAAFGRGFDPADVSLRDLHDAYLPLLDGETPTAIFCNRPDASWIWPFMERFGHKNDLRRNMREVGAFDPVSLEGTAKWLAATPCLTVVYIEIPPTSPLFEPNFIPADNSAIKLALKSQAVFHMVKRIRIDNRGTVWVWKR